MVEILCNILHLSSSIFRECWILKGEKCCNIRFFAQKILKRSSAVKCHCLVLHASEAPTQSLTPQINLLQQYRCFTTFINMNRAFNRKKDKTWMHSPEALTKHFIPYNVKFLGNAEVEQPKGTESAKDAVRKLKFARHIKKSEGQKTPKVELQISIYGVKILDSKTKEILHNCQLHRISFCADDKTDKKIFTFICKDAESNKHLCYVFDSEKCAEEITLTIGQAFDLAYKKFLETGGKDVETRKQIASLQKRIQELETENIQLKKKVQELEIKVNVTQGPSSPKVMVPQSPSTDLFDMVPFSPASPLLPMPSSNGTEPPPLPVRSSETKRDIFGAEPFDPFISAGGDFPPDIQSKLDEMQEGFKMGLTLEGTVFSLDPLDSRC
ncbi:PTB domain-containing engulfment adapter protein 1-like isoform X1 [Hemitrygon akajei]|uniref:PTB domain-containing engulfment adapter protein 1-like isoform X1 n=2 Tax=Dasyatidae TaxID=30469 RepID=UPI003BF9F3E3